MAAKVSINKIDSTVERMDSYFCSVEIIILALKKHMITFLKHTTFKKITLTVVTGKYQVPETVTETFAHTTQE